MNHDQIVKSFKASFGEDEFDYIRHVRKVGKTTVRCEFVDYLDYLRRDGQITEEQQFETTAGDEELFYYEGGWIV